MTERMFKVGDVIYPTKDVEKYGLDGRLFRVTEEHFNPHGDAFVSVQPLSLPDSEPWLAYELGWEKYVPPLPSEVGAAEYEEIMTIQETSRGDR